MYSPFSLRSVGLAVCFSAALCFLGNDLLAAEPLGDARAKAAREKMTKKLFHQLGTIKPHKSNKKEETDFWVVGTAELNTATKHVDVCFQVKEGQQESAEYLADFLLPPRNETLRKWQAFYRVKDSYTADEAVASIRKQYDQFSAYREQMMKQYKAKSIRRA